jgi:hypothetical protein
VTVRRLAPGEVEPLRGATVVVLERLLGER